jgi:hypothetical protein
VCNLTDTGHTMMRNHVPNHNIATVTKTYMLLQDLRVDHFMMMMMMMHDLLATHMMRTTSLANSSSPYQSSWVTTMSTLTSHGRRRCSYSTPRIGFIKRSQKTKSEKGEKREASKTEK